MAVVVRFRQYRKGDDAEIKKLVSDSAYVTVNRFFLNAVTKEFTAQIVLILSAIIFVILDFPLYYAIGSVPISFFAIYAFIYLGHWLKVIRTHSDLSDITGVYSNPKLFIVAELGYDESPPSPDYKFVGQSYSFLPCGEPLSIVGTVALDVKCDPDMKDPPRSVSWLRRFAVASKHRKQGIGSRLLDFAIDHCVQHNFKAIELITTHCHDSARNLYYSKGFKIVNSSKKKILGGLFSVGMYQFRRDLDSCMKNSLLNA